MIVRLRSSIKRIVLGLAMCVPLIVQAANDTIIIGQSIDLSSPNADIGRDYVAGIKTYFDAVNAAGGINGKRILYIVRDDEGRPETASRQITELIEREQIDYVIGGVGEATTQAILDTPAFKRSNLILLAPLAGSAAQKDSSRVLFWRPSYQQEIRYLFSHFDRLGAKSVGIAYQDTSLNKEAYNNLLAVIRERGIPVTGTASISSNGKAMEDEARKLALSRPGFVIVIADTIGTGLFLKEFRTFENKIFVASTSLVNLSTLREVAGIKAIGWTVFSQVVPNPFGSGSVIQSEHLKMMKKYRDESVSSLTLEGFAVAKGLAKAIERAKPGSRLALQELMARKAEIDLGGLYLIPSAKTNRLSSYLDIALFHKGTDLLF